MGHSVYLQQLLSQNTQYLDRQPQSVVRLCVYEVNRKQESCAIAKMTAQCALYMGALTIFVTS